MNFIQFIVIHIISGINAEDVLPAPGESLELPDEEKHRRILNAGLAAIAVILSLLLICLTYHCILKLRSEREARRASTNEQVRRQQELQVKDEVIIGGGPQGLFYPLEIDFV